MTTQHRECMSATPSSSDGTNQSLEEHVRCSVGPGVADGVGGAMGAMEPDDYDEPDLEGDPVSLRDQAISLKHLLTHFPKNPYCPACNWARLRRTPTGIKHRGWRAAKAKKFGDVITCDHVIPYEADREDVDDRRTAFVIYDIGTKFIACYPLKDKTAESAEIAIRHFLGPQAVALLYSDGSGEIDAAARSLGVPP